MHILFCTHDIDSGGSARSLSILVEHLAKRHTVSILSLTAPSPHKKIARRYFELGIPLTIFEWGWIPVSYVGCVVNEASHRARCENLRQFIPQVRKLAENVDLICFNSYPATSLASLFPASIPKYLIAREVIVESSPQFARIGKFLRGQIKKAIAIGPVEAAQLEKFGIPHAIVYNCSSQIPTFHPFPDTPPLRFGVFTQINVHKGVDTLALAAEMAAPVLRRCKAVIHVHGGSNKTDINTVEGAIRHFVAQKGLDDVLRLEGWANDVVAAMKNMHCIVRPDATGSPWGRDIIEAMSLGRPVLSTGSTDVFVKEGKTGWLVPPQDTAALARTLAGLARSPSLISRLGENAYAFAEKHFNPEVNSQCIENILLS